MLNLNWFKKYSDLSLAEKLKWLLFCCIIVLATIRRFSLPPAPFADMDAGGYLNLSVNYFASGEFVLNNSRIFLYPLFLCLIIKTTHSLHAISAIQHLLGLFTGILIFRLWEERIFKGYGSFLVTVVRLALQFITSGYFLLSTGIIFYEHAIRPESIEMFLMVLLINMLVKSLFSAPRGPIILGLSFFLSLFMFGFLPRWGFALPVTLIYLVFTLAKLELPWLQKILILVMPAVAFCVFIVLPGRYLARQNNGVTNMLMPTQFFYSHAEIVKPIIEADCKSTETVMPCNHDILLQIDSSLVLTAPHDRHFSYLGFSPDELMYGKASLKIDSLLSGAGDCGKLFYLYYDKRIVINGFRLYIERVVKELWIFYACNTGFERLYLYEQSVYSSLYNALQFPPHIINEIAPFKKYNTEVASYAGYNVPSSFRFLNLLYYGFQLTFLPIIIVFMAIYFCCFFYADNIRVAASHAYSQLGHVCCLLLFIHLGLTFTVAALHTFGIERYGTSLFPVSLLLQSFCVFYIVASGEYLLRLFEKNE